MHAQSEQFLQNIKDKVEKASALGRMSAWLPKHTRLGAKPFSFSGHEYQIDIVNSTHPSVVCLKPSQVGMTEAILRITLGLLAVTDNCVALYSMPSSVMALKMSKSRIDPIIAASPYLSGSVAKGSDSASFKQIGNSQLHVLGTWGSNPIISVAGDLIVNDEVDFSSQAVLRTMESRLSHSQFYDEGLDIRGLRRGFSTPTLPEFGVSLEFGQSDRRYRLAKCKSCRQWFWPEFLKHVVVDGWDRPMEEMVADDAKALWDKGKAKTARLLCPHCHNTVTPANLGPDYREWVAECPHVTAKQGFWVSPFDLPGYNTPASLLLKQIDYGDEVAHYRNFSLGVPYVNASNMVLLDVVRENASLPPAYPGGPVPYGTVVAGCDVGKTSHFLVGASTPDGLDVIWGEAITLRGADDGTLVDRIKDLVKLFRIQRLVIDALPYSDTVLALQAALPGLVWANSYTLRDRLLPAYLTDERDCTVKANRTKSLDAVAKKVNAGKVRFAQFPLFPALLSHLAGLKRVDTLDEQGNWAGEWQRTGQDHCFHSLNYLNIASDMVAQSYYTGFAVLPGFKEALPGSRAPA